MYLVPIPRDGSVRLSGVTLPEVAMSVIASTVQMYERRGYVEPWVGYLAIEGGKCVGTCGFTSFPTGDVAEIAYFTFPDFEKRGVAETQGHHHPSHLLTTAHNMHYSTK